MLWITADVVIGGLFYYNLFDGGNEMIWYAVINLVVYMIAGLYIFNLGKKCKVEHDKLMSEAEYFVAEPLQRWKGGMFFWILGILQLMSMMIFFRFEIFAFFSPIVTLLEWGIACELWNRYKTIVIYVKEGSVFYFKKKKWHSIPISELKEIVPWVGNVAFTFFNDQNEKLFDVYTRYENAQLFLQQLSEIMSNNEKDIS